MYHKFISLFSFLIVIGVIFGCATKVDKPSRPKTTSTNDMERSLNNLKAALDGLEKIEKAFNESPIDKETNKKFNDIVYQECINIGNSINYCACYATTLTDGMGHISKQRYAKMGTYNKNHIAMATAFSRYRYNVCEEMRDMAPPVFVINKKAKEILEKYKGHILTPENRLSLKPKLDVGYEFSLVGFKSSGEIRKVSSIERVVKVDGNTLFIARVNSKGAADKRPYQKIENGIVYSRNFGSSGEYKIEQDFACIFKIGKCKYQRSEKSALINAYSNYVDGVWITRIPGRADETIQHARIFKDDGLLLYHAKIMHSGEISEMVRVDSLENPEQFEVLVENK